MPTSTYAHVPVVAKYLEEVNPTSVLDIGLGNGKMGFIARDLLDVMIGGRAYRDQWQVRIDGIEAYKPYVQEHQRAVYDEIYIGDAFDIIDRLDRYEMVIIGDVLEHFDRPRAEAFLDKAASHATKAILLSIPMGEQWTQDAIYGNDYERHRSFWDVHELQPYASQATAFVFEGLGLYGCFLIKPEVYCSVRRERALGHANATYLSSPDEAIAGLVTVLDALPPDLASELQLAELMVRRGLYAKAAVRLDRVRTSFTRVESFQKYIDQLHALNLKAAA